MKNKARKLTESAMIAGVYAVLTLVFWQFSSLQVQVRISEALCVLPMFSFSAVPGLTIGCFLINMIMGNVWDAIFGTLATLLASAATYRIGKNPKYRWLAPLPSVLFNALIIPFVLYFGYGFVSFGNTTGMLAVLGLNALSIAIGQTIACYGLGMPLYFMIKRTKIFS